MITKLMTTKEIVALLREQANLRFVEDGIENDIAGMLRSAAYRIELEVAKLEGEAMPFYGLDACETE